MKTASLRTYRDGPGRICIARWAPRNYPAGYRMYKALQPGEWFNSVSPDEYSRRYAALLSRLNPRATYMALGDLHPTEEPVLLCWETPPFHVPHNFCHRRMVAAWFQKTLGIVVPELGADLAKSEDQVEIPEAFQDWLDAL